MFAHSLVGAAPLPWLPHTGDFNALWLENIEIKGFPSFAIHGGEKNKMTFINCRFVENRGTVQNSALLVLGPNSTAFVRGCEFFDNAASNHGGGIQVGFSPASLYSGAVVEVIDTVFARNSAPLGGAAVFVLGGSQLTVRNCSMYDNVAIMNSGGAIWSNGAAAGIEAKPLTIEDSQFRNNTAQEDGGAVFTNAATNLQISNTVFTDNVANTGNGGAIRVDSRSIVTIATSSFERNNARNGAGGALWTTESEVQMSDANFTANNAGGTDGGAVQSEGQSAVLYVRGATHFTRNTAREHGGGISLDSSALKTNEAALTFAGNEARLGGALSAQNAATVLISPGCQTTTFEMHWASTAGNSLYPRVLVRRIQDTQTESVAPTPVPTTNATSRAISSRIIDDHGEWMLLFPSPGENTNASLCLTAGDYEVVGSEDECSGVGWGGGFVRVVDLTGAEVTSVTLTEADGCTATVTMTIPEGATTTSSVLFTENVAKGTSSEFCGAGCGGAFFVGEECSADLDRVDFSRNSAADGGALYIDLLSDLKLSRATVRNNTAISGNGGAISAGTISTVSVSRTVAKHNTARLSGGGLFFSGVAAVALRGVEATSNKAGTNGGAVAVVDSVRTTATLTNSVVRRNVAGNNGGGLFIESSKVVAEGVQLAENTAKDGSGGATAAEGAATNLAFSDSECVDVDILIDWTTAGNRCPTLAHDLLSTYTCETMTWYLGVTCSEVVPAILALGFSGIDPDSCSGCGCNDR